MMDMEKTTHQNIDIESNSEIQSLYESLISVLKKEIEVYRELQSVFRDEKEILIKSSIDELNENNSKKETCILKAKMLDGVRSNTVNKIMQSLNLDRREINLSILISCGSKEHAHELKKCQTALRSRLSEINELNKKNKVLISSSLYYVHKSIEFIGQLMSSPDSTYMNNGKLKTNSASGKMVCREG